MLRFSIHNKSQFVIFYYEEFTMAITLKLDGLHCGNCVKSVEKALSAVEGVEKVNVTLDPQQAIIEGNVSAQTLIEAVEDIGFEASV